MKNSRQVPGSASGTTAALIGVWLGGALLASAQTNSTNAATNATTNAANNVATNGTAKAEETNAPSLFKPLEPGEYNNWLQLGVGGFSVSGDKAAFQQRHQMPANAFGGVEEFHYETPFKKKGLLTLDGRGIFDNHDYGITAGLSYPDLGYVRTGYREFRTWYDGSGGFFPPNGQWLNLYDEKLHVDRGEAFIEAGLTVPNAPNVFFRYSHEFRDGKKDSTIWGDTALTGGLGTRAIVPSFYDIHEERDLIQLDVKHTIGKTDFGIGGRVDLLTQDNSLNLRRRPGETGTTILGPGTSIDRYVTQRNSLDADNYNVHAFTDTRLTKNVRFTLGGSFTTMDTDISGSRVYGPGYDAIYDPLFVRRQERDSGFFNLGGGATWKQYVGNANVIITPWEHVDLVPSLRVEHVTQDGTTHFTSTDVGAAPTFTATQDNLQNHQNHYFTDVTEALELRYTGLTNWVFYLRGEWLEGQQDSTEKQNDTDVFPATTTILRDTDSTSFGQKYVLGINWYPRRHLNMALQFYYKERKIDYEHEVDSTPNDAASGNRYPAFIVDQKFRTEDVNYRITWQPCRFFSSVSRYDFQRSIIDMVGDQLAYTESGNLVTHIFSESLTLSPWNPVYIQLGGSYVIDKVDTPATDQTGAAAGLVSTSHNDYWTVNSVIGVALDERTDLQTQYYFYQSRDYINNSAVSTPYGTQSREHGVTVGLTRMLTRRLKVGLKYGFFDYHDDTSGGHNNYSAHMIYSSLQYRF